MTPSVSLRSTAPSTSPQKKYFVFFWGPRGRSQGELRFLRLSNLIPRAKPRFCASENKIPRGGFPSVSQIMAQAGFPCAASRAVEPALAREFPHNGKFPVNKWQRAHRALCKKAFVHTQFASYQRLIVLRKTTRRDGDKTS